MEEQSLPVYPKLWVTPNLVDPNMVEARPWEFELPEEYPFEGMNKKQRREFLKTDACKWQVYSAFRAQAPGLRVSTENHAVACRAIVIDYDAILDPEAAVKLIEQELPEHLRPNLVEITQSKKLRLLWILSKEVMFMSSAHWREIFELLCKTLKLKTLLPGYDENSAKTTEVWTNGGEWFFLSNEKPLSEEFIAGIVTQAAKKESLFGHADVPLAKIEEKMKEMFPGRWEGEFKLNAQGVRFWDPKADNPTGCQVKPDGMLCYTGNVPFMPWDKIFGKVWCDEQRSLKLGNVAKGMYTDGKTYFEVINGLQVDSSRDAIITRLKSLGLSDKVGKGETQSEVGQVLNYIQTANRVLGAAPMINYPPGIVEIENERILNLSTLKPVQPVKPPRSFAEDAPFLHWFFCVHQCVGEGTPYLLYWALRSSQNYRFFRRELGQAIFICGPVNSGKTLLNIRIFGPMFGGKTSDPMKYLMGETTFTDDLFTAGLLAVNDSDYPKTEALRLKVLQGYKDWVVNPKHVYHPKFQKKLSIESVTRLCTTLNDSADAAGSLPEVNDSTRDKFMFFRMKPVPPGTFKSKEETEATIARELPYFVWWLENEWQCPPEILLPDGERTGCKSYFDPFILKLAQTMTYNSNLAEILRLWTSVHEDFQEGACGYFEGSATDILSALQRCEETATISREWKQQMVARNLLGLSKIEGSGVTLARDDSGRYFRIVRINES